MYNYAILDPRNPAKAPEAVEANDKVFSAAVGVYGIEISVPALAARCVGNLDPQHSGGMNVAACEAALTCELPPPGATLATVRPDADSVTAMAVLAARKMAGDGYPWPGALFDESRVRLIAKADTAPSGPWRKDYSPPADFARANSIAMDTRSPLWERVEKIYLWIRNYGPLSDCPMPDHSGVEVHLSECGRYAVARADGVAGRGACGAGYRVAPIVIAINEAFAMRGEPPHRKYTVARWNSTHVPMNWAGMLEELNQLEPGWAGSGDSICGSPQGTASTLSLSEVIGIVERHLPPTE